MDETDRNPVFPRRANPPRAVSALRIVNLGVRFALELVSLGVFACWGAGISASTIDRTVAAIALPIAVATFWGVFVSPKARIPTGRLGRAALGLVVFLAAAAALHDRGHFALAEALAAISVVSSLVSYVLPCWRHVGSPMCVVQALATCLMTDIASRGSHDVN